MKTARLLGIAGLAGGIALLGVACGPDEPEPLHFDQPEEAPPVEGEGFAPAAPEEPAEREPLLPAEPAPARGVGEDVLTPEIDEEWTPPQD